MAEGSRTTPSSASARAAQSHDEDHGHSTAAWTLVGLALLGALVVSIAVILAETWLAFVGVAIIVVGLIAGKVLQAMGFGQKVYDETQASDPNRTQGVR